VIRPLAAALASVVVAGCGADRVERPLSVDIRGLSARASALVVKLRTEATACRDVDDTTAPALSADEEHRWDRASGAERAFALSPVTGDAVTVVAYALDEASRPFQHACRTVTYDELGNLASGRVIITLSRRVSAAPIVER
jgi:outer membrane murein-binding lipoprotein Lpp